MGPTAYLMGEKKLFAAMEKHTNVVKISWSILRYLKIKQEKYAAEGSRDVKELNQPTNLVEEINRKIMVWLSSKIAANLCWKQPE